MTALPISISRVTRSPRCPTGDASFRERMSQSSQATQTFFFYLNPPSLGHKTMRHCSPRDRGRTDWVNRMGFYYFWIVQVFYSLLSCFTMCSIHLVGKVTHLLHSLVLRSLPTAYVCSFFWSRSIFPFAEKQISREHEEYDLIAKAWSKSVESYGAKNDDSHYFLHFQYLHAYFARKI